MENYIDCRKILYNNILEFLEESNNVNQLPFEKLCEILKKYHLEEDQEVMRQFLLIIKNISDHHHRDSDFNENIEKILQHYKEQIKQTLSNNEIFHIFENNKFIVHFLLKNDIISISEEIYNDMLYKIEYNGNRYCYFFYPELEKFKFGEEMKCIKKQLLSHDPTIFDHFEEKRQEGENDFYICSLIRKDTVEEFIAYINRHSISLSSEITPSIFETNSFLINQKSTTLIEYSAFFGSIQIFQYLIFNKVELTNSLWLYSIHSKNPELIHILESNKIRNEDKEDKEDNGYLISLIESIKCHHNDFSKYIENNLMSQQEAESIQTKDKIISNSIKYYNCSYFQPDLIKKQGFFYLCLYNYNNLGNILLKEKEEEIKKKIIT